MQFSISGRHIEVSGAVKSHAMDKVSKLPRFYDSINQVEVIIDGKEAKNFGVEVIARAEHKKVFVVKQRGADVYACIDMAVHKLENQLRKRKTRERDKKRRRRPGSSE